MVSNLTTPPAFSSHTSYAKAPAIRNGMPSGKVARADRFESPNALPKKTASPKFAGLGGAVVGGGLGFAGAAAVCWPLAAGTALIGCFPFLHFLWPLAGLLAVAPFGVAALTGFLGGRR